MSPAELEQYLHRHIPLSSAMGVTVLGADTQEVALHVPIAPNVNHRETVFGGSAAAASMLAAWSLLHLRVTAAGARARLVIRRSALDFATPLAGDFVVRAALDADDAAWSRFLTTYARRGLARIGARAVCSEGGRDAVSFTGEFAALR